MIKIMNIENTKNINKYIYVLLTSTPSKFGKIIRAVTHAEYNHVSMATNDELSDICTFARRKLKTPLNAGFTHERLEYYTRNKYSNIGVIVYKIPVTEEQYKDVTELLNEIENDKEYMYNLFSALTYPIIGGFRTYKAFTCVEFVASVLNKAGVITIDKAHKITPEEYGNILDDYKYYVGNLEDILKESESIDNEFFAHDNIKEYMLINTITLAKLAKRLGSKIKGKVTHYEIYG